MKNTFLSAIIALFVGVTANAQSTVDSITAKYKLLPMPAPLTIEKTFPVLGAYQLTTGDALATNSQSVSVSTQATSAPVSNASQTDSAAPSTTTSNTATSVPATTTDVAAAEATPSVTITLDSVNKGIVWVDGLPEGRFKAYLKKSPTTYRILSQKTNLGKEISEGTLHYDVETHALHIALGKSYNEEDPTGIFAVNAPATTDVATTSTASVSKNKSSKSKSKSKVTYYTASKVITEPAVETEAQGGGATTQDQDQ